MRTSQFDWFLPYLHNNLSIINFLKSSSISIRLIESSPTISRKSGFCELAALRTTLATSIGSKPASILGLNAAMLFWINSAYGELLSLLAAEVMTFIPVLKLFAAFVLVPAQCRCLPCDGEPTGQQAQHLLARLQRDRRSRGTRPGAHAFHSAAAPAEGRPTAAPRGTGADRPQGGSAPAAVRGRVRHRPLN